MRCGIDTEHKAPAIGWVSVENTCIAVCPTCFGNAPQVEGLTRHMFRQHKQR